MMPSFSTDETERTRWSMWRMAVSVVGGFAVDVGVVVSIVQLVMFFFVSSSLRAGHVFVCFLNTIGCI
jgi:hypothetical protein